MHGSNYANASLYNNSKTAQMLALLAVYIDGSISSQYQFASTRGAVGTVAQAGFPTITGDPNPPGVIYTGSSAAAGTGAEFYFGATPASSPIVTAWPIAVLQPNTSFVCYAQGNGSDVTIGWMWEWIYPDELDIRYWASPPADQRVAP